MSDKKSDLELFGEYFLRFERSAFRLETLEQYLVECEKVPFQEFRSGEPLPSARQGDIAEWDRIVTANIAAGKKMQRIHVLPERMTPYLRFEIEWGYVFTATIGEDVRLVLSHAPSEVRRQAVKDFWLFDDSVVFFMNYDLDGRFIGVEKSLDSAVVRRCCQLRDILLPHAITLREYLATTRNA
jgi:hypothetical protein